MKECKRCRSKDIVFVEFSWWYDWTSIHECKSCWTKFDRRTGERIIIIYNSWEYSQPMFVLDDGSVSWKQERRYNPEHKKNKPNWIKPRWEKVELWIKDQWIVQWY